MPEGKSLPPELGFAYGGLHVAYRAAIEPQLLELDVELVAPDPIGRVPIVVRRLLDEINGGAATGAIFPPALGQARLVDGSLEVPAPGPQYRFILEVAAVSPRFLRHAVESLSGRGDVRNLALNGALPLDDTPLSVREAEVTAWMHQPRTHLEASPPPFTVNEIPWSGRSAFVRAVLLDSTSDEALQAFDEALLIACGVLLSYGQPGGFGRSRLVIPPGAGRGGRVLAARWEDFLCERRPARDLLVNVMSAFHARTSPIERLDLGLPG